MSNKIFSVADARKFARRRLPRMIFDFIDGSAGEERACELNVEMIEALRRLPDILRMGIRASPANRRYAWSAAR